MPRQAFNELNRGCPLSDGQDKVQSATLSRPIFHPVFGLALSFFFLSHIMHLTVREILRGNSLYRNDLCG